MADTERRRNTGHTSSYWTTSNGSWRVQSAESAECRERRLESGDRSFLFEILAPDTFLRILQKKIINQNGIKGLRLFKSEIT
jgi:hypothetical protein